MIGNFILRVTLIFFACSFTFFQASGQAQDSAYKNINFTELPFNYQVGYKDSKGANIGCGWSLECQYSNLKIKKAIFNKPLKQLELEGFYLFGQSTSQPFDFEIFLGRPDNDTLRNIKRVAYIESLQSINSRDSTTHFGDGYFHITMSFSKEDKLYFNAGSAMALKEYDIGFLLRNEKF